MRAFVIRILVLLISLNVAYGTSGDVYAEEVQSLITTSQQLYKPNPANTELFCSLRSANGTKKITKLVPRLHLDCGTQVIAKWPLRIETGLRTLQKCYSTRVFAILRIKRVIFPHHFFL